MKLLLILKTLRASVAVTMERPVLKVVHFVVSFFFRRGNLDCYARNIVKVVMQSLGCELIFLKRSGITILFIKFMFTFGIINYIISVTKRNFYLKRKWYVIFQLAHYYYFFCFIKLQFKDSLKKTLWYILML